MWQVCNTAFISNCLLIFVNSDYGGANLCSDAEFSGS